MLSSLIFHFKLLTFEQTNKFSAQGKSSCVLGTNILHCAVLIKETMIPLSNKKQQMNGQNTVKSIASILNPTVF